MLFSADDDGLTGLTMTGRRSQLPVPKSNTGDLSLWNLLTRNIGKDLSKISMPVALNEPLSMLQVRNRTTLDLFSGKVEACSVINISSSIVW